MDELNILHLARTMNYGGAEKVVYQLAAGIHKKGEHVVVASCGGVYVTLLKEQEIPHYQISDMECKNPKLMIQTVKSLVKIVKDERIDIIHTHHRMAAVYAAVLKIFFPKIKLIYTAHNVFYNKKGLTDLALFSSQIVAVGESVKKNLIEYFHIQPEKIEIIYNAIMPENMDINVCFHELNKLKNQNYVLVGIIGRLSEQKGVDVFIRALKLVKERKSNVKGIIIGDGEQKEVLQQLIAELGMEKDILMLGYQSHVNALLYQLDLVVIPSRWEGFPLTPIEVFAAKKTLVASDIGGINEIVKHGQNGLLVPKDQVQAFSRAIIELLENQELREQMEENGRRFYEKHFSCEKFLTQYYLIYQKILNKGK